MPRTAQFPPRYYHWKARNRGFAKWKGERVVFPGAFRSYESEFAFSEWVKGLEHPTNAVQDSIDGRHRMVHLIERFRLHCESHYGNGRASGAASAKYAMVDLVGAVRQLRPDQFTPKHLLAYRAKLVNKGLSRSTINSRVGWVKRLFKWAVVEGIAKPATWQALTAVEGLKRGRDGVKERKPRGPVDPRDVDAVLPHLPKVVRAMVEFQRLVGCRSGSLVLAKPEQFSPSPTNANILHWRPRHKTEHRGVELVLPIGPKAQEIIAPYLKHRPYCFKPGGARGGSHWSPWSYRRAVVRAQEKAILAAQEAREKLASEGGDPETIRIPRPWTPHQMRHAVGHAVRDQFGLEGAQAILGHENAKTTEIYSARQLRLAELIATELG